MPPSLFRSVYVPYLPVDVGAGETFKTEFRMIENEYHLVGRGRVFPFWTGTNLFNYLYGVLDMHLYVFFFFLLFRIHLVGSALSLSLD